LNRSAGWASHKQWTCASRLNGFRRVSPTKTELLFVVINVVTFLMQSSTTSWYDRSEGTSDSSPLQIKIERVVAHSNYHSIRFRKTILHSTFVLNTDNDWRILSSCTKHDKNPLSCVLLVTTPWLFWCVHEKMHCLTIVCPLFDPTLRLISKQIHYLWSLFANANTKMCLRIKRGLS
jgi:hypothetical protein